MITRRLCAPELIHEIVFYLFPVVIFTNDAGLVPFSAGGPSLRHPDAVWHHVCHMHRRRPVRGHQHVRLYGGRGKAHIEWGE